MKQKSGRRSQALRALCLSTILTGIAAPHAAFAQDATVPQATPADGSAPTGGFDEIIVTATRKSENVQKVPIAIQALSSDFLAQRQVKGLQDYAALLPSVSFAGIGPGRNEVYFRGIVPAGGAYASVGYYLDEIPITGQEVPDIQVYDMERLEAISGPQGTLFGAGSLAGVLRFITNKPKIGKFEFGADSEVNKFGKGGFGGTIKSYINIPISDRLAIRAMGYYRKEGGYIDNTDNKGQFISGTSDNPLVANPRPAVLNLGDNNPATSYTLSNSSIAKKDYNPVYEYGGRLSMLWDVTDGWEVTPTVTAQRQISYGYFGYDPRVGDLQVHDYDLTRNDDKWVQASLTVHGHIGDFDLVSATGYYYRDRKINNDYTYYTVTYDSFGAGYENYLQFFDKSGCSGSGASLKCTKLLNPNQYYHTDISNRKFTQELRLTTPKTWPFDVTVGGFYQRQKNEFNDYYAIRGLDQIVGYTESGGGDNNPEGFGIPQSQGGTMILGTPAVRGDAYYLQEYDTLYHDTAVFAEAHYNITPAIKVTGGIRYFWTDLPPQASRASALPPLLHLRSSCQPGQPAVRCLSLARAWSAATPTRSIRRASAATVKRVRPTRSWSIGSLPIRSCCTSTIQPASAPAATTARCVCARPTRSRKSSLRRRRTSPKRSPTSRSVSRARSTTCSASTQPSIWKNGTISSTASSWPAPRAQAIPATPARPKSRVSSTMQSSSSARPRFPAAAPTMMAS